MSDLDLVKLEKFVDAMVLAIVAADEQELLEDAKLAGEDLTGTSKQLRARFLDRVALAHARAVGQRQMELAEVSAQLARCSNCDQALAAIGELAVRHLAPMCIVVAIVDDQTSPIASGKREGDEHLTVAHADAMKMAAARALIKFSTRSISRITHSVLATRQPRRFEDITTELFRPHCESDGQRFVLRELALRSALVVPLSSDADVRGALILTSSHAREFGICDVELATDFARRAALALENVRRHEAEQRAIRARDEVLGIVAHDLRSPLQSINLAAQLLDRKLGKAGDDKGREHVAVIMTSVARANRLIQDLLDISCTEAGALLLVREVVAVRPVVVHAVDSLQLSASAASIQLQLSIDDELPALWADQGRIVQVLENLIGNAIKFTPTGGRVTVTVTGKAEAVQIAVADTGAGISEHSLPHVFDRFWQADNAMHRGVGLGLPICKGIIEAHGGEIWVESTPGRGAAFFFTIPAPAQRMQQESSAPLDGS